MFESYEFLKLILNTVTENIVVIDSAGEIRYVNKAWIAFGKDNDSEIGESWRGLNYLTECDKAAAMGDEFSIHAAAGIRLVINGKKETFYYEYPCHSPDEKRWFMMRVTPFTMQGLHYFVISHKNITERKLIEEEVASLARLDGLTNISNRRYFNGFLSEEWRRCQRLDMPISLAIIDLDYFKQLNDTYGHQEGDECLKAIGKLLRKFDRRPSDISARYGGEEFAIVFGNTDKDQAKALVYQLLKDIRALNIPNENSPTSSTLTASIGLATMRPSKESNEAELIKRADDALYTAKENGRNQVFVYLEGL